jgi:hypothetical protein
MMDFADDFTCCSMDEILREAQQLYRFNKHIEKISLETSAKQQPVLVFYIRMPKLLTLKQLGLPIAFRRIRTRLHAANSEL